VNIQADDIIDRDYIAQTERLIRPHVGRTSIVEVDAADFGLAATRLSFKLELLQHAGSFKTRGAFANLLTREIPRAGAVAASGGNHGAAVAYASMRLGISAKIFVPRSHHLRRFRESATIGPNWSSQVTAMPMLSRQVKPGQSNQERSRSTPSTSAKHFWAREPSGWRRRSRDPISTRFSSLPAAAGLSAVLLQWYGGQGQGSWRRTQSCPTLSMALKEGGPVDAPAGGIAAASLAPRRIGSLVYPIAKRHVDRVVLVPDEAINRTQLALWETLRVVAEPGGAAAFAALVSGRYEPRPGEHVGILLSGGNTTAVNFA
jgi:threonine dehydratase